MFCCCFFINISRRCSEWRDRFVIKVTCGKKYLSENFTYFWVAWLVVRMNLSNCYLKSSIFKSQFRLSSMWENNVFRTCDHPQPCVLNYWIILNFLIISFFKEILIFRIYGVHWNYFAINFIKVHCLSFQTVNNLKIISLGVDHELRDARGGMC